MSRVLNLLLLGMCFLIPFHAFSESEETPSPPVEDTELSDVEYFGPPATQRTNAHPYLTQESSTIAEAEPSSFVNGSVNAITGTFYHTAVDFTVPGPVPLNLRHYYNGACFFNNWMGYAAMATNYNPFVQGLLSEPDAHHLKMIAEEDGGSVVQYVAKNKKGCKSLGFYLHPKVIHEGFTNAGSGMISARTNMKNTRYHLYSHEPLPDLDGGKARWFGFLSDGSARKYNKVHTFEQRMHLLWERRPNKNLIQFKYGKNHEHDGNEGKLKRIIATDPTGKEPSNWLEFHYSNKHKKARVTASNGKEAIYTFFEGDDGSKMNERVRYVRKIIASDAIATYFNYTRIHRKHYISKVFHPRGRFLEIEYDHKGRVSAQKAPVGKDGDKRTIYSFEYKPDEHHTNVWNAHDILTVYRYSHKKRLKGIENHLDKHFYRGLYFYWGEKEHIAHGERDTSDEGYLVGKSLQNKDGRALASWTAKYDDYGNIVEEAFYGSLTGKRPEDFAVSSDGTPLNAHVECYRKYYTYSKDHLHLKMSESEDDGPTIKYAYKEGTDLVTAKFTHKEDGIKIREFFSYDNEGILIKHIVDDGCSHDPDNLKEVTERRITRITPNGRRCEYGVGQPETVKEYYLDIESGKEVKLLQKDYRYTKPGLVGQEEIRDADDHLVATTYFEYDHKGNLSKKTDPIGRTWVYEYDSNNNKTREELLKSGLYLTYTYDLMNRLIAQKEHHADGTFCTYHEYDTVGNRVSTTDPFGNTTNFEYDDLNRLVKTIYPAMHGADKQKIHPTLSQHYDEQDCLVKQTDANENTTKYTYTSRKQPLTITHPDEAEERFQYFLNGKIDHKWDKNGTKTSYEYDFLGRITEVKIYDSHDHKLASTCSNYNAFHLLSATDAMGNTTHYEYDGAGRKIKEVKKDGENFSKTTYEYDALGRVTATKTWYGKDVHDYVASIVTYDAVNRIICEQQEDGSGELLSKVCYEYDMHDHRTKVITSITKETTAVTQVEYNTHNLAEVIIDEDSHKTKIKYDFAHKNYHDQKVLKITTIDPLENVTIEVKDVFGKRKAIERRNHKEKLLSRSHYFYDAVGNVTREQHVSVIDGEEDHEYVIAKEYDAMHRVIKLTEQPERSHQKVTEYGYYPSGCLKTITKPDGVKIYHSYDALLRLESMKSSEKSIQYTYEYDLNNNPIAIKDEVADTTNRRCYDAWNRLTKETLANKVKVAYEYDSLGRLLKFELPDDSYVKYNYHKGHLSEVIRKSKDHKTLYQHRYNDIDQRAQVLKSTLIGNAGTVQFVYDKKGRTRKIRAPKWKLLIPSGGFDDAGNLRKLHVKDRVGRVQGYFDYDDLYQLIKEEGALKHKFEHDSLNNCIKKDGEKQKVDHLNRVVESKDADFEYDKNGNLIKKRENKKTTHYRYDALNRLIEAYEEGEFRARYSYDSFHRRISKTLGAWEHKHWKEKSELRFLYLHEREVGSVDHHNKIVEFRAIGRGKGAEMGASVSIEVDGSCYAPVHDHRGNICSLIGAKSGKVREVARYSAFGEMQLFTGKGKKVDSSRVGNPWHFVSKRFDPETGFVYFGKRYYSPETGRWITPDPIGFSDGPNLYAYVHNSPLLLLDPYGLYAGVVDGCPVDYQSLSWYDVFCRVVWPVRMCMGHNDRAFVAVIAGQMVGNKEAVFVNGVLNSPKDAIATGRAASQLAGGKQVTLVYNPSHGILLDLFEAFLNLIGIPTGPSKVVAKTTTGYTDQGKKVLVTGHSQGAVHTKLAVEEMTKEQQKQISIVLVAPATTMQQGELKGAKNICSKRDPVPYANPWGLYRNKDYIEWIEPHPEAPLFDHPFQSPTYEKPLKDTYEEFFKEDNTPPCIAHNNDAQGSNVTKEEKVP